MGPVVEHRVDQQLLREGWAAAITGQQAHASRQTAPGAVAHHSDAGRINAQRRGVLRKPAKGHVTVLDRRGMRMLGGDPVVHHQHRHAGGGDVVAYRQIVDEAEVLQAEDHAAAVQVQHRTAGLMPGRVIPAEGQRRAVRGRERVPVDLHPGEGFHVLAT